MSSMVAVAVKRLSEAIISDPPAIPCYQHL